MGVDGNTVDVSAAVSLDVVVDCDEDTADLSAVVVISRDYQLKNYVNDYAFIVFTHT